MRWSGRFRYKETILKISGLILFNQKYSITTYSIFH